MCQPKLQKIPDRKILAGWMFSWVLKLCHLTETQIPPTIYINVHINGFVYTNVDLNDYINLHMNAHSESFLFFAT